MNKILLEQLHRYAEDREIDYSSAQYLGEQLGVIWKSQRQLVEFKNAIDYYLKTFDQNKFAIVESMLNELCGKSSGSGIEAFAAKTRVTKPNADKGKVGPSGKGKKKAKKVVKEDFQKKKINESRDATIEVYTSNDSSECKRIYTIAERVYKLSYKVIDHDEYGVELTQFSGPIYNLQDFFENELDGELEEFENCII